MRCVGFTTSEGVIVEDSSSSVGGVFLRADAAGLLDFLKNGTVGVDEAIGVAGV